MLSYPFVLSILFSIFLFQQNTFAAFEINGYVNIPDQLVVTKLSRQGQEPTLPNRFGLMTWNTQKNNGGEQFFLDFQNLSKGKSLILTQEAMNDNQFPNFLNYLNRFTTLMAQSFAFTETAYTTGVATLSSALPTFAYFRRSPGTEPFAGTPKMTLASVYQLASGLPLLVLNVHAINFVTNGEFYKQIDDLFPFIAKFSGKIIVAGDFNTWNYSRMAFLKSRMELLGLTHVEIENDPRWLKLDHLFVKGCRAEVIQIHSEIKSSDHFPISAVLNCQ